MNINSDIRASQSFLDADNSEANELRSFPLAGLSSPTRRGFCRSAISGAGLLLATGGLSRTLAQDSSGTLNLDETEHFVPAPGTSESEFVKAGTVSMTKSISKSYVNDGDLFLRHEDYGRRYPENSDRPSMFYRESTIWSAPLAQVIDPGRKQVDSEMSYSAMTSWRPWMKMGDTPGHTASNGFGRRARTITDLPEDYRAFLRGVHPDVLEDPEALLTIDSA
jgi:hypothetical protein